MPTWQRVQILNTKKNMQGSVSTSNLPQQIPKRGLSNNHNKQTFIKIKQKQLEKKCVEAVDKNLMRRNAVKKDSQLAPKKLIQPKEVSEYEPKGREERKESPFSINF